MCDSYQYFVGVLIVAGHFVIHGLSAFVPISESEIHKRTYIGYEGLETDDFLSGLLAPHYKIYIQGDLAIFHTHISPDS